MIIRIANFTEFDNVRSFYHQMIDLMEGNKYKPGWKKGIYPSDEYLQEALNNEELWVCECKNEIAAAMVVNHNNNDEYETVKWFVDTDKDNVLVIHALGVMPDFQGSGIAGAMVKKVIEIAENSNQKAVRLDVLMGNIPAEKLYTKYGFRYIDTVKMFYEDTGWTDFKLFEYKI